MAADMERGRVLMSQDRAADALPIFERIAAENPDLYVDSPGGALPLHIAALLGGAYLRTGQWAKALPWLEQYYAWAKATNPQADLLTPGMIDYCRKRMLAEGTPIEPLALVEGRRFVSAPELSIERGASLAPLRALCEDLAAAVSWDESTQSATASLRAKAITFTLGSDIAMANGSQAALPVAPYLNAEWRMMVPVRPLVEALGGEVNWQPEGQMIHVTPPQRTWRWHHPRG
jgi:hypothetical protein